MAHVPFPWQPPFSADLSRNQRRQHLGPYVAALVPPIADLELNISTAQQAESEDAALALAQFDRDATRSLGGRDRSEDAGEIAPMATILLRSESASSSQIENLTVGARQLALAELGQPASPNAVLVSGNVAAMRAAVALAGSVTEQNILDMHAALLGGSDPGHAGRWRDEAVSIGGSGAGPHRASFVPPHHDRVAEAVADLVDFIARDDLPIVPQAAVAHAQFETIHPFTDGNGRTGRAVLAAMLRQKGLTRHVTVPLSAGLLADTGTYFDALTAYRAGNPAAIMGRVNDACFAAVSNGRRLIDDLAGLQQMWRRTLGTRSGSASQRLLRLLPAQPVINTGYVANALSVSPVAAQRAVDQLLAAGIVTQTSPGRRNRIWESTDVLVALDAFARRAGRRRL